MGKTSIPNNKIKEIKKLRQSGHSLSEIVKITDCKKTTVYRYIKNVLVSSKYQNILKSKQGGSKRRSENQWNNNAKNRAKIILSNLSAREKVVILASLY